MPRKSWFRLAVALGVTLLWSACPPAHALGIGVERVASGLVQPVVLKAPPGDQRRFIVEQHGRILIMGPDDRLRAEPFLDIRERVIELDPQFEERGLLGLAFHPGFVRNGKFYVYYSAPLRPGAEPDWDHTSRVSEFRVWPPDANRADPASERVVIEIDQPQANHNAGALEFGPDGYLYIATGDGGGSSDSDFGHAPEGNAQAKGRLLGKILRIDVAGIPYRIPPDNPFVDDVFYRPEIFALGLRNPYRCTFDAGGEHGLFCGDVGEGGYEEIDLIEAGGNYGWRIMEGRHCFDPEDPLEHPETCDQTGLTPPIVEYANCTLTDDCRGRSVIGGYVYRGQAIPELRGRYVFGDWAAEMDELGPPFYAALPSAPGEPWAIEPLIVTTQPFHTYILAFGQDAEGELYILASDGIGPDPSESLGAIYKVVADPKLTTAAR